MKNVILWNVCWTTVFYWKVKGSLCVGELHTNTLKSINVENFSVETQQSFLFVLLSYTYRCQQ
jgi:hypothetical protein